jgi:hypothetical protein
MATQSALTQSMFSVSPEFGEGSGIAHPQKLAGTPRSFGEDWAPDAAPNKFARPNGASMCRVRLEVIADRSAKSLVNFIEGAVEPGAQVVSDAWRGYNTLTKRVIDMC